MHRTKELAVKLWAWLSGQVEEPTELSVSALADEDYPALFRAADGHAKSQQARFFWCLLAELALLVVATVLSIVNPSSANVAALNALVLFGVLGPAVYIYLAKPDRHWYRARAIAESVKTMAWRYAARAEPFQTDDDEARRHFRERLRDVVTQNSEITQRFCTDLEAPTVTDRMETVRRLGLDERKLAYVDGRVREQRRWYGRKARINNRLGTRFFVLLVASVLVAAGFAIFRVSYPKTQFWPTDVFVALASAVLAWSQSKRFSELAASYTLAAHEIGIIVDESEGVTTDDELSKFVGDAENAFSREHTQWAARRDI